MSLTVKRTCDQCGKINESDNYYTAPRSWFTISYNIVTYNEDEISKEVCSLDCAINILVHMRIAKEKEKQWQK